MLRASAAANNMPVNLAAVTKPGVDSEIEHGDTLIAFADALTGKDIQLLAQARANLVTALGGGALVHAAAIAANFSMNDRAANAMGIPMESFFLDDSADFRDALGINEFTSARNTLARSK